LAGERSFVDRDEILRSLYARDTPEGKYTLSASNNSDFCTGGIATLNLPANRWHPPDALPVETGRPTIDATAVSTTLAHD